MPQVLQQMMRHADIQTTMRFYIDLKASDLGEVIYQANGAEIGTNHKKTDQESPVLDGE